MEVGPTRTRARGFTCRTEALRQAGGVERRSGGRPGQANSTLRQQGGPVALKTGVGSWGLRPKVRTDARPPAGRASLLPKGSRHSEARGGVLKGHWCGGGGGRARPPSGQDAALHCGGLGPVPGPGTEAPKPQGRAYTGASMNRSAEAQLIHAHCSSIDGSRDDCTK